MASGAPNPQPGPGEDRLDSWKEIAAYLKRQVRTVQRWEKSEALPVHRHLHEKAGSVYAYRWELDAWWRERQQTLGARAESEEVPADEAAAAEADSSEADAAPRVRSKRGIALLLLAVAVAATAIAIAILARRPSLTARTVVAVLPFRNLSGDPEQQYFATGLTEEMIARLARVLPSRLSVIPLTANYAGSSPQQIGKQFRADYLLQGSVRRADGRVAITAQLVQTRTQTVVWGDSFERDLSDVLRIQDDVADSISREILDTLPAERAARPRAVNPDAYSLYLKGRFFWNKRSTESLFKAIDYFQQAIAKDPTYAPAYAGIADSYNLLGSTGYAALPPREAFPKAIAAAQKALAIDEHTAEAHVSLGYARLVYEWNPPAAEPEFRRALELNPSYATAHQYYSYYLIATGKGADAIAEAGRAEQLDPLSPVIASALGEMYYFAHQYDRSIEESKKAVELDPGFGLGLFNLGRAYGRTGRHDEAIKVYQDALQHGEDPGLLVALGYEYGVTGQRAEALKIAARLREMGKTRYIPALYLAAVYTGIGDKPQALAWFRRAYDERCDYFVYVPHEPMADPLRDDPGFIALLKKTGLPLKAGSTEVR